MRVIPLFGSGTKGKSSVVTSQRRLNVYFENREDGDKSKVVIYGTPGLAIALSIFENGNFLSPVRGMVSSGKRLFSVIGGHFHDTTVNSLDGSIPNNDLTYPVFTSGGLCSLAINDHQVAIADGETGYLYTPSTLAFANMMASYPQAANTVTNVSGFFVAEEPGSQKFWVSDFNDGTTWDSDAFASASAYQDNILAVDNLLGNLIIFSEQHMEFWQNAGLSPQPFAPIVSAVNEFGLAAIFSRAHVDQSIIFLAQTREGGLQVIQLNGFQAQPVSTADIDYIFGQFDTVSDAVALTYEIGKHKFYQITFPTENRSFLFDCSTRIWSEVQTGESVTPVRHAGNLSTYFQGQSLISDYQISSLYLMSDTKYTDTNNLTTIPREIITRHIFSEFNRIRISLLYLDMETGVGTTQVFPGTAGSNPQIMLQYSKDNGRTWGAERWVSLGKIGQYMTRVIWRRFGSTRDALFKIRMTDPVKFVITTGALRLNEREGQ